MHAHQNLLGVRIQTVRLMLEPVSMRFRNEIFKEFDEEITRFMGPRPAKEMVETEQFINSSMKNMQEGKELVFAVVDKAAGEFLGCAGLHGMLTSLPELGVWIKKSAHHHKYGREAVTAIQQWADKNMKYEHLRYPVAADNHSSRAIAESLGAEVVREYEHTTMSGKTLPFVDYYIDPS